MLEEGYDCLRLKYTFSGLGCVVSLVLLGEEFAVAIIFLCKNLLSGDISYYLKQQSQPINQMTT
jgi:hypothetical protein